VRNHVYTPCLSTKDLSGVNGTDGTVKYHVVSADGDSRGNLSIYVACPGGAPINRATINLEPPISGAFTSVMGYTPEGHPMTGK
jgi:hypothetical protein